MLASSNPVKQLKAFIIVFESVEWLYFKMFFILKYVKIIFIFKNIFNINPDLKTSKTY